MKVEVEKKVLLKHQWWVITDRGLEKYTRGRSGKTVPWRKHVLEALKWDWTRQSAVLWVSFPIKLEPTWMSQYKKHKVVLLHLTSWRYPWCMVRQRIEYWEQWSERQCCLKARNKTQCNKIISPSLNKFNLEWPQMLLYICAHQMNSHISFANSLMFLLNLTKKKHIFNKKKIP